MPLLRFIGSTFMLLCISITAITAQSSTTVFVPVSTDGCGTTKRCLQSPEGCQAPGNCEALLTWRMTEIGFVDFEMMAVTDGWVAFGLSYDSLMGNDSVIHCINNREVGLSYNDPAQFNTALPSDSSNILKNVSWMYVNGQVYCRFQRSINANEPHIFALNYSYYLLLGYGPVSSTFGIVRHRVDPHVSRDVIDLTSGIAMNVPPTTSAVPPTGGGSFSDGSGNLATFYGDGDYLHLELTGASSKDWVALAFSEDRSMGEDSVVSCSLEDVGKSTIVAKHSYNDGDTNTPVNNANNGIIIISSSIENGAIKCTLKKKATGLGDKKIFDLNKSYFLFLGAGEIQQGGSFLMHTNTPAISQSKEDVMESNGTVADQSMDTRLLRAHGTLMITAWVLLVSPAILLARYFKTAWPSKTLCNRPTTIWFMLHRQLNLIALACTIAGFIIVFVYVRQPSPLTINDIFSQNPSAYPGYYWVHGPLGIIVMILVVANPLVAAFRCEPHGKYRFVFNWMHWVIGTTCHLLALITVFFGVKMGESRPDAANRLCHIAVFWILIAFVAFHVIVEFVLLLYKFFYEEDERGVTFKSQTFELTSTGHGAKYDTEEDSPKRFEPFRTILIICYAVVVLGLWLAMIILISSGKVE